jgi:ribonuclease HI
MSFRPFPGKSAYRSQEMPGGAISSVEQGYLVANIDGGARGNPGPAGYGVVFEDEVGRPVAQLSEFLGHQTNNYAEYSALLAALNYTLRHGFKALKVTSDSELLVKQINGHYKVSNAALKELHGRAVKMLDQLDYFQITHVPREKNREADRLANLAMDRGIAKRAPAIAATDVGGVASVLPEVNGVVRKGVVEFLENSLPDGTHVKIRVAEPSVTTVASSS